VVFSPRNGTKSSGWKLGDFEVIWDVDVLVRELERHGWSKRRNAQLGGCKREQEV
jgi:hypothetical protein